MARALGPVPYGVGTQDGYSIRALVDAPAPPSTSSLWQVLEERQRLWLSELKRLYVERLHEVAHKAERSERNLQLQLFMAQQEQRRLRKELRAQQGLPPEPRPPEADPTTRPEEEARWEVRGQALRNFLVPIAIIPSPSQSPLPGFAWLLPILCPLSGVPEDSGDQPPEAAAAGRPG